MSLFPGSFLLGSQVGVGLIQLEDNPDHVLIIREEGLAVVIIAPAVAVGVALAGENGDTFFFGMDAEEGCPLVFAGLGGQADEPFQTQAIQGHVILDTGIAQIQILEAVAAGQRRDIGDLRTIGKLQPQKALAVFEAIQGGDGTAGKDQRLQLGHILNKAGIRKGIVVAKVRVDHIFQVFQRTTGAVCDVFHTPDDGIVGEGRISAADTEADPPDHLGAFPEVLPELCQDLIIQAALIQNKTLAVIQDRQRFAQLGLAIVSDFRFLINDLGIRCGQGLTENLL